jgi:PAS domain S-box-containing protein
VDVQEASDSLQRILGGEVVRKESVRRRKDGSLVDVSVLAYPIRFNDKLVGAYGVYSDITKRKEMEEAIRQAAEEWRRTFDSISDAISIHDRDFRIQRANKAFADIFQMSLDQIIGKHCYELHKGGKPHSGCPHQQTLATEKPAATEFYESHLGKFLWESTSPIFNENGEVVGTVHITRDITEQKQQNEQLMMADRLASIGELAAGAAHELNNPLTSIIGFSQLLMEKDTPDYIRKNLALICSEAQRAASVTSNLLTFARKHRPVKQLTQINDIIEDVLKLRAYGHKSNRIEVERHLAPDLPEIMVDGFQMQQVFLNIIINAEYFMTVAHKRGTLTITTKKQNGSTVRISIADDGPGIPEENLSRIFNPFFTTKEAGKGTGLGLSICHGIVAEHGGQIYARSEPGKGATFVIELPINGR